MRLGYEFRLMTLKQYMKMSKPALIRKITKTLTAMPI